MRALSSMRDWRTREQRLRGIALALGTAQMIDGGAYLFAPVRLMTIATRETNFRFFCFLFCVKF